MTAVGSIAQIYLEIVVALVIAIGGTIYGGKKLTPLKLVDQPVTRWVRAPRDCALSKPQPCATAHLRRRVYNVCFSSCAVVRCEWATLTRA